MNIKLVVAYEGTNYFGWQKTFTGPSIEEKLEEALTHILNEKIFLQAASRTDRGVHASGQVVNFHTTKLISDFPKFIIGVNSLLPPDIAVLHAEEAPPDFHPTLHVKTKIYTYEICTGMIQLPRHRLFSWHYHYSLDLTLMHSASQKLIGTHDFSAFTNHKKNETYLDHVRTVEKITLEEIDVSRLRFTLQGPHFLYKMVRNLVGTLAYIGRGKITLSGLDNILSHKDRTLAGMTAPAHGLTLAKVLYEHQ